jgi:hypothetical protein
VTGARKAQRKTPREPAGADKTKTWQSGLGHGCLLQTEHLKGKPEVSRIRHARGVAEGGFPLMNARAIWRTWSVMRWRVPRGQGNCSLCPLVPVWQLLFWVNRLAVRFGSSQ